MQRKLSALVFGKSLLASDLVMQIIIKILCAQYKLVSSYLFHILMHV